MTTIADKLDLANREFSAVYKDRELGQVELFRAVLSPLFRFIMINRLVIIHTRNGIGEEITTEQFIYFVMVLLKPIIDDYIVTLNSTIQGEVLKCRGLPPSVREEHEKICATLRNQIYIIGQFGKLSIECVKRILDHMVIVLQGEAYWNKLVAKEESEEEEEGEEDVFIKEISTARSHSSVQ